MSDYYVYVYWDLSKKVDSIYETFRFEYEPMYVGKGWGNRVTAHLRPSIRDNDVYFHRHLKKMKEENIGFFKIQEDLSEESAFDLETHLISLLGKRVNNTGVLYNLTDGGEGTSGRVSPMKGKHHSEKTKKRIGEANKGKHFYWLGKKQPESANIKRSAALRGVPKKPFSEKHIENLKKSHIGKKISEETRQRMRTAQQARADR